MPVQHGQRHGHAHDQLCCADPADPCGQPTAPSTSSYVVAWSANNAVAFRYDLQESATADFANPTETQTTAQTVTIPAKGTAITH